MLADLIRLYRRRGDRGSLTGGVAGFGTPPLFGAPFAMTTNTPVQNTANGRDALLTITVQITAATGATLAAGVGTASTVATGLTTQSVLPATSITGNFVLTLYVPFNSWAVIVSGGTITATYQAIWQYL